MARDETFKNWTEGIHSLVLSLAVVLGGGWTVWEFSSLLKTQTAQAELSLVEAQAAQEWAKMGAPLNFSIATQQMSTPAGQQLLAIDVTVSNSGSRGTTMNIEDRPLRVSKVALGPDGAVSMGPVRYVSRLKLRGAEEQADGHGEVADVTHIVVLPNQTKTLAFLIPVPEAGIYLVEFRAHLDAKDMEEWKRAGIPSDRTTSWTASKYVSVKDGA